MQLRLGIRVIPNLLSLGDTIEINSGSAPYEKATHTDHQFEPGAMVPVSEWRIPNQAEKELLIGWPSVNQSGGWIALLELPEKLISPFHIARSITRNAKRREEVLEIWTENARVAKAEFDHFIREQLGPGSSQDSTLQLSGGIRVNDPQMPTVTVHPNTKRLVGLHVDDWYSQNLEYRHQSPNRISINLAVQDRFF